jgi:ComF family protein
LERPAQRPDAGLAGWLCRTLCRTGRRTLDLLLPPQCALCETAVGEPGQLCAACFSATSFITAPLCARCGVPFGIAGQGDGGGLCPSCRDAPPVFGQARAALRYDRQGRRLILPFKHGDRTELARALAQPMARAGAAMLDRAELLVPVPLHRRRLFHRGYNQAALLAQALAKVADRPVLPDALQRVRATVPLGGKTAPERAAVVNDAFAVRPKRQGAIAGRRILLIDDVMTSGATANACATVLLAAGARSVDVLVAARVPDPRLG